MKAIRAICFDLDNTLWDVWPVILRAEQVMYDFLTQRYPRVVAGMTIEAMREARARVAVDHPHMSHDFSFLRLQSLRNQASEYGYEEGMAEAAFAVFIRARNEVELYAEVRPALETLRSRYRLFTASNGNANLASIGLTHLFERSVAARDVGALKPDGAMFLKVIEATDLQPSEVLFVGDDPEHDVEGARRAGMQPVWINRGAAQWPAGIEPAPYCVKNLDELTELLGLVRTLRQ
ncbi:MAG TPA: HAD family hydrolase [Steroidobacteraceae bacterium]|jgi:putative hydrolase of the HAD superfamily